VHRHRSDNIPSGGLNTMNLRLDFDGGRSPPAMNWRELEQPGESGSVLASY